MQPDQTLYKGPTTEANNSLAAANIRDGMSATTGMSGQSSPPAARKPTGNGIVSGADMLNSFQPVQIGLPTFRNGGLIKGAGTATSDSVPAKIAQTGEPIKVSNGERIVSAEQEKTLMKIAKARGFKTVDEMFEADTGKPVGPTIKGGKMAAEDGKRPSVYADNFINDGINRVKARLAEKGSDAQTLVNGKPNLTAEQPASAGVKQARVAPAPLVQPAPAPVAAAPSLKAPWWSPEYAKAANASDLNGLELERARRPAESSNDPLKSLILSGTAGATNAPTAAAAAPTAQQSPIAQAYADPSRKLDVSPSAAPAAVATAQVDPASNASILARNPSGAVTKSVQPNGVTSYSGNNVAGETSFVGSDGQPISGRPKGGFMVAPGMPQAEIDRILTKPDGTRWTAGDNATMAANIRDGVDKYRGIAGAVDPLSQPMSRGKRGQLLTAKSAAATAAIQQGELDLRKQDSLLKQSFEQQKKALFEAYQNAKPGSPERAQAEAAYRLLVGHNGNQQIAEKFVTNVVKDADGNERVVVTNTSTGGQPGAQAAKATTKAEYDAMKSGTPFVAPDGSRRIKP